MKDAGPLDVSQTLQRIQHGINVISVNRPEITEPERFEKSTSETVHKRSLRGTHQILHLTAKPAVTHLVPNLVLQLVIGRIRRQFQQVIMQSSDILVNRTIVVIENDEEVAMACAGIVQALKGQTSGQCAIADESDDFFVNALHRGCAGKPQSC